MIDQPGRQSVAGLIRSGPGGAYYPGRRDGPLNADLYRRSG